MSNAERSQRRELWRQRVAQQKNSGQSVRAFCREHKLTEHPFYWWRRELNASEQPMRFALVEAATPPGEAPPARQEGLELILHGGGERLRIPAGAAVLRLVLRVLREG